VLSFHVGKAFQKFLILNIGLQTRGLTVKGGTIVFNANCHFKNLICVKYDGYFISSFLHLLQTDSRMCYHIAIKI